MRKFRSSEGKYQGGYIIIPFFSFVTCAQIISLALSFSYCWVDLLSNIGRCARNASVGGITKNPTTICAGRKKLQRHSNPSLPEETGAQKSKVDFTSVLIHVNLYSTNRGEENGTWYHYITLEVKKLKTHASKVTKYDWKEQYHIFLVITEINVNKWRKADIEQSLLTEVFTSSSFLAPPFLFGCFIPHTRIWNQW